MEHTASPRSRNAPGHSKTSARSPQASPRINSHRGGQTHQLLRLHPRGKQREPTSGAQMTRCPGQDSRIWGKLGRAQPSALASLSLHSVALTHLSHFLLSAIVLAAAQPGLAAHRHTQHRFSNTHKLHRARTPLFTKRFQTCECGLHTPMSTQSQAHPSRSLPNDQGKWQRSAVRCAAKKGGRKDGMQM